MCFRLVVSIAYWKSTTLGGSMKLKNQRRQREIQMVTSSICRMCARRISLTKNPSATLPTVNSLKSNDFFLQLHQERHCKFRCVGSHFAFCTVDLKNRECISSCSSSHDVTWPWKAALSAHFDRTPSFCKAMPLVAKTDGMICECKLDTQMFSTNGI